MGYKSYVAEGKSLDKFSLEADVFSYGTHQYSFDDIEHILFYRQVIDKSINAIPFRTTDTTYLQLYLGSKGALPIAVTIHRPFVMNLLVNKKKELDKLFEIYSFLSEKTFNRRLSIYGQQIEEKGCFEYDDCFFYIKEGKVVVKNVEFPVESTSFTKTPFYISLKNKNEKKGLMDRLKNRYTIANDFGFHTSTDTDVIFTLLDHYFGLRWKNR
jgi:hypothetical protein